MSKQIKVLTIINGFGIGGIERTLLSCLPFFSSANINHSICCFNDIGPLRTDYNNYINKVFKIRKTGSIIYDMIQLYNVLIKDKPDMVHSRFGFTSGGVVLICKLLRIPVIVSLHSETSTMLSSSNNFIFLKFKKIYLGIHKIITKKLANIIVGHSKNNLVSFESNWLMISKFRLIYNGIPIIKYDISKHAARKSLGLLETKKYILHIGSFRYEKNHELLIKIFEGIHSKNDNTILLLVGDGLLRKNIEQFVAEKELNDHIIFCGQLENVSQYYRAADIFLFTSISEGLGNVLIEAQLMNLPVVCTSIKPHYEALAPQQYSNMFDLTNYQQGIDNVLTILKNGVNTSILKESNRFVNNRFDIKIMVDNLTTLYKEIKFK